jgi:hypothetical protein
MEHSSLQNKHDVIQPFIAASKTKQNKTKLKAKTTDAPRKTHSA